jgi:DNA-binding transcriptional regulator YhcF (GntR family)
MSGYVRIHRTLIEHPAFRTDAEAMAFAWLVAKASWKPARVRYKGHPITLGRGELAISVRDFAVAMDRDKAWVERLWKRLKSETMVETRAETGVTVVTICNYDKYQSEPVLCETPRETETRQTQDTEQGMEEREEVKSRRKRAAPVDLPEWLPAEPWAAFKKMRKAMKVPFTDDAERGIIADLDALRGEGHCPTKLLMKAVKRGWRGVFPDEDTKATINRQSKPLTATELPNAIRYNRDQGNEARALELEAQLAALREQPPDSNVTRLIRQAAAGMR